MSEVVSLDDDDATEEKKVPMVPVDPCRMCFGPETGYSLLQPTLKLFKAWVYKWMSVEVNEENGLSHKICHICMKKIQDWITFHTSVKRVQRKHFPLPEDFVDISRLDSSTNQLRDEVKNESSVSSTKTEPERSSDTSTVATEPTESTDSSAPEPTVDTTNPTELPTDVSRVTESAKCADVSSVTKPTESTDTPCTTETHESSDTSLEIIEDTDTEKSKVDSNKITSNLRECRVKLTSLNDVVKTEKPLIRDEEVTPEETPEKSSPQKRRYNIDDDDDDDDEKSSSSGEEKTRQDETYKPSKRPTLSLTARRRALRNQQPRETSPVRETRSTSRHLSLAESESDASSKHDLRSSSGNTSRTLQSVENKNKRKRSSKSSRKSFRKRRNWSGRFASDVSTESSEDSDFRPEGDSSESLSENSDRASPMSIDNLDEQSNDSSKPKPSRKIIFSHPLSPLPDVPEETKEVVLQSDTKNQNSVSQIVTKAVSAVSDLLDIENEALVDKLTEAEVGVFNEQESPQETQEQDDESENTAIFEESQNAVIDESPSQPEFIDINSQTVTEDVLETEENTEVNNIKISCVQSLAKSAESSGPSPSSTPPIQPKQTLKPINLAKLMSPSSAKSGTENDKEAENESIRASIAAQLSGASVRRNLSVPQSPIVDNEPLLNQPMVIERGPVSVGGQSNLNFRLETSNIPQQQSAENISQPSPVDRQQHILQPSPVVLNLQNSRPSTTQNLILQPTSRPSGNQSILVLTSNQAIIRSQTIETTSNPSPTMSQPPIILNKNLIAPTSTATINVTLAPQQKQKRIVIFKPISNQQLGPTVLHQNQAVFLPPTTQSNQQQQNQQLGLTVLHQNQELFLPTTQSNQQQQNQQQGTTILHQNQAVFLPPTTETNQQQQIRSPMPENQAAFLQRSEPNQQPQTRFVSIQSIQRLNSPQGQVTMSVPSPLVSQNVTTTSVTSPVVGSTNLTKEQLDYNLAMQIRNSPYFHGIPKDQQEKVHVIIAKHQLQILQHDAKLQKISQQKSQSHLRLIQPQTNVSPRNQVNSVTQAQPVSTQAIPSQVLEVPQNVPEETLVRIEPQQSSRPASANQSITTQQTSSVLSQLTSQVSAAAAQKPVTQPSLLRPAVLQAISKKTTPEVIDLDTDDAQPTRGSPSSTSQQPQYNSKLPTTSVNNLDIQALPPEALAQLGLTLEPSSPVEVPARVPAPPQKQLGTNEPSVVASPTPRHTETNVSSPALWHTETNVVTSPTPRCTETNVVSNPAPTYTETNVVSSPAPRHTETNVVSNPTPRSTEPVEQPLTSVIVPCRQSPLTPHSLSPTVSNPQVSPSLRNSPSVVDGQSASKMPPLVKAVDLRRMRESKNLAKVAPSVSNVAQSGNLQIQNQQLLTQNQSQGFTNNGNSTSQIPMLINQTSQVAMQSQFSPSSQNQTNYQNVAPTSQYSNLPYVPASNVVPQPTLRSPIGNTTNLQHQQYPNMPQQQYPNLPQQQYSNIQQQNRFVAQQQNSNSSVQNPNMLQQQYSDVRQQQQNRFVAQQQNYNPSVQNPNMLQNQHSNIQQQQNPYLAQQQNPNSAVQNYNYQQNTQSYPNMPNTTFNHSGFMPTNTGQMSLINSNNTPIMTPQVNNHAITMQQSMSVQNPNQVVQNSQYYSHQVSNTQMLGNQGNVGAVYSNNQFGNVVQNSPIQQTQQNYQGYRQPPGYANAVNYQAQQRMVHQQQQQQSMIQHQQITIQQRNVVQNQQQMTTMESYQRHQQLQQQQQTNIQIQHSTFLPQNATNLVPQNLNSGPLSNGIQQNNIFLTQASLNRPPSDSNQVNTIPRLSENVASTQNQVDNTRQNVINNQSQLQNTQLKIALNSVQFDSLFPRQLIDRHVQNVEILEDTSGEQSGSTLQHENIGYVTNQRLIEKIINDVITNENTQLNNENAAKQLSETTINTQTTQNMINSKVPSSVIQNPRQQSGSNKPCVVIKKTLGQVPSNSSETFSAASIGLKEILQIQEPLRTANDLVRNSQNLVNESTALQDTQRKTSKIVSRNADSTLATCTAVNNICVTPEIEKANSDAINQILSISGTDKSIVNVSEGSETCGNNPAGVLKETQVITVTSSQESEDFEEEIVGNFVTERPKMKCPKCEEKFTDFKKLTNHLSQHSTQNSQNSDNSSQNCLPIIDIEKPKEDFKCYFCDKKFMKQNTMEQHILQHLGIKPFQCQYCPNSFSKHASLLNHTRTHTGERPFECQLCDKKYVSKPALFSHMKSHNKPMHVCKTCDKCFTYARELNIHIRYDHDDKSILPFACDMCRSAFKAAITLANHVTKKHGNIIKTIPPPKNIKKSMIINCKICKKKFNSVHLLNFHIKKKHTKKKYECKICQFSTNNKDLLKLHVANHESCKFKQKLEERKKISKFPCVYCEINFTCDETLNCHINECHALEYPFPCGDCVMRLKTELAYVDHVRIHEPQGVYPCKKCDKTFKSKIDRSAHVKKIHNIKYNYKN